MPVGSTCAVSAIKIRTLFGAQAQHTFKLDVRVARKSA